VVFSAVTDRKERTVGAEWIGYEKEASGVPALTLKTPANLLLVVR